MNEHEICFIMRSGKKDFEDECIKYLSRLRVPDSFDINLLVIHGDGSAYSDFNEAMKRSDAKYKVYMNDDVFIRNREFIKDLLKIFDEQDIGMIGMLGVKELDNDGVLEHTQRYGGKMRRDYALNYCANPIKSFYEKYTEVVAIDSFLMATQYDIPWREDLFDGGEFYNISQSAEFRRKGYRIVVPGQGEKPWVIYENHRNNCKDNEEYRKKIISEYAKDFKLDLESTRMICMYTPGMKFDDISWAFLKIGCAPQIIDTNLDMNTESEIMDDVYEDIIGSYHPDAVFSYDFIPVFSDVCERLKVPYISWVFDAPQQALSYPAVRNKCNYIFSFDREQVKEVKERGASHVYHMPLGVNTERLGGLVISEGDERKFSCDVSFIGNNYYDELYDQAEELMNEDVKEEYNALINDVYNKWDGIDRISGKLSDRCVEQLKNLHRASFESASFRMDAREFFEIRLIAHRAAFLERMEMLRRIAGYDVRFFTRSKNAEIPGIKIYPGIDYASELPKAYHLSRININSTLHTIKSGIPLRVFDIMGVGGFVLTNYQPEIEELFKDGVDLAVYHDLDEFEDKVRYYLEHEDERMRVAISGYKKARQEYDLTNRFRNIWELTQVDGGLEMITQNRTIV